jgi:hypothetical protein
MTLKDKIAEFVDLAKQCPDKFQEICFKVLLENYLSDAKADAPDKKKQPQAPETPTAKLEETVKHQGDIKQSDVHVKVRRFMEKQSVSLEDLNLVFYKEGEAFMPLYDSLGTTKTSESQIRVSLMRSLQSALTSGEFQADIEEIRSECQLRKCYDASNFKNNFANNARLFDFKKFSKGVKTVSLSDAGKAKLAEVVKDLK